jgi:hypothetical protein
MTWQAGADILAEENAALRAKLDRLRLAVASELNDETLEILRDECELQRACGDARLGAAIGALLDWFERARKELA